MPGDIPSLTVRQAKRREIALGAQVAVAPGHEQVVRLAAAAASRTGWFVATAVDMSEGGLGFVTETFLPRGCAARVRLLDPRDNDTTVFEATVRVKRAQMVDRRPAYLVGAVFDESGAEFTERLTVFLRQIDGAAA